MRTINLVDQVGLGVEIEWLRTPHLINKTQFKGITFAKRQTLESYVFEKRVATVLVEESWTARAIIGCGGGARPAEYSKVTITVIADRIIRVV